MPTYGDYTDFTLDPASFVTGQINEIAQNIDGFNASSNGAIVLDAEFLAGHYANNLSDFLPEDIWTRRDVTAGTTAIASADKFKMTEVNERSVKVNRKAYVANTLDSLAKKFGPMSYEEASLFLGQQFAKRLMKKQFNDGLLVAKAAITGQSDSLYTIANNSANNAGKMNSLALNSGLALVGDASERIEILIMHSKVWRDLIGDQVYQKIPDVAGYNLFEGGPATYQKRVLVTDSDSLKATIGSGSTAYTAYYTLGLVGEAVKVTQSETTRLVTDIKAGTENLLLEMQSEAAYNLMVRGFQWDSTNGGLNPSNASLATTTNHDPVYSNVKLRAGFAIQSR